MFSNTVAAAVVPMLVSPLCGGVPALGPLVESGGFVTVNGGRQEAQWCWGPGVQRSGAAAPIEQDADRR